MPNDFLIELLYGKGAHVNPLVCCEDLPLGLVGAALHGFPHSIWQLVWHMNYWMDYELRRIGGQAPPYPTHAAESWPVEAQPLGAAEWRSEVLRFSRMLGELADLARSAPEVLARSLAVTTPAHAQQSNTLQAVLWQTAMHNSYHVGQIALLRRCMNAWPPKGGGDSW